MQYALEIDNLTKDYETGFFRKRRVRALDGVSLKAEQGRIFGILGGNGAGKTTTIKILMRLLFPTSGTARILGRDISDTSVHKLIGYSPENPYFYDYLTPRELLHYFAALFGLDSATAKNRCEDLLDRVGLEVESRDKHLRKFSKGMLQRVSLAQSLINDPEIVFLDEPMSGLDPIGRREIRELISSLRSEGKTVFMSTHILADVEALCDEVAVLRKGKVAAAGRLDTLLAQAGTPDMFEIVFTNAKGSLPAESLFDGLAQHKTFSSNGLTIKVSGNRNVVQAIEVASAAGFSLVSVTPAHGRLDDLFIEKPEK